MSANGVSDGELLSWVEKSVENENFLEYGINIVGKSEKGDGYVGDIVFANVTGTTKNNEKKILELVVKHGKSNDYFRSIYPARAAFETEIHIYDTILPEYEIFQRDKNIENIFDAFPKCYKTLLLDKMEVIVLGNLKQAGYEIHDKLKPFDLNHLKKIVTEYGKLHALSFALRDQQPEKFSRLTPARPDIIKHFLVDKGMRQTMIKIVDEVKNLLKEENEVSLLEKFNSALTKDPTDLTVDLMTEETSEVVISHGDCWNNNFLFKYEDDDRTTPSKVALLDFQLSCLRSPVFDLTYLLYSTCSKEQLNSFNEIMDVYYSSFSSFLKKLGSDPEVLFPYSSLKNHWRKYSFFGVTFVQLILKFVFCGKEDTPAMDDLREGDNLGKMAEINLDKGYKDLYNDRIISVLKHHFEYKF